MDMYTTLISTLFAAVLGLLGQGLRAAAGLKKQADLAAATGRSFKDLFDATALGLSLGIGALAGIAGYIALQYGTDAGADLRNGTVVLGIISAGYSGADFIESFIKRLP